MYTRSAFSPTFSPGPFRTEGPEGGANEGDRAAPAIMIRKLPRTTSEDTLTSMLIFAGDLIDTELIRSPYPDDHGFATAVARFKSQAGAIDAQQKLNGKTNTAKEANMIVELHTGGALERRATIDSTNGRTSRSRFGSTFQSHDKISPPLVTSSSGSSNEFPVPDSNSHFQTLFSPQSPLGNGFGISGKSVINDDGADDETGELLKDPVAYAKNGQKRRPTMPQLPIARFSNLSLSTNGSPSPALNGMTSPRSITSPLSPTYPHPRPQYPPVNPADQNPPCNTLYVGNLPIDASEDELKAIFSKQRGYKRLCFRTKQNGPMCFVEFEDVSFATKALNELYGHPLHNSVKGGIRLSFSKNPLGVRSGQTGGLPSNPVSPVATGYVSGMNAGFSGVSGPPPGLMAPPGLSNGGQRSPPPMSIDGIFSNAFNQAYEQSPRHYSAGIPPQVSGGIPPQMSGQYGRDGRYNDYMLGR